MDRVEASQQVHREQMQKIPDLWTEKASLL